ncbi:hypothetical protein [Ectobacillus panaciterrae]|uniref:hypothetical protein n=1 Tax=Ectobacillus panaciterrae TaxID=363872 RepID=UPI0003FE6BA7|nr:hypothetical protein [Ectobacillus panaciterrae]
MKQKKKLLSYVVLTTALTTGWALYSDAGQAYAASESKVELQTAKSDTIRVVKFNKLNPIALEITFSKPIPQEDLILNQAQKNFVFSNGLKLTNVPQLKTGAESTYIVPVSVQKPGEKYTLTYKGKKMRTFTGSRDKLKLSSVKQVTNDTFELESFRSNGILDYQYVVAADAEKMGNLAVTLDKHNRYNGVRYDIIPSLRDQKVTITPEGGEPMTASYVPFTQATDGRQAPKFRLPQGQTLKLGTKYTVMADWAIVEKQTFIAADVAPLVISSAKQAGPASVEVTLSQDPKDELFALRQIKLTAEDGSELLAQYKFTSRKGASGTFDILNNSALKPGTAYKVEPIGGWAEAANVTL